MLTPSLSEHYGYPQFQFPYSAHAWNKKFWVNLPHSPYKVYSATAPAQNGAGSFLEPFKETVSRDFWPLVFFVKHLPLGHCFTPLSVFANHFEFTEIFKLKVDSAVSLTPLSQKNFLRQPPVFKHLPQRRRVGKCTLAWILLDCLFKENESL
jgi:hypothetical protein